MRNLVDRARQAYRDYLSLRAARPEAEDFDTWLAQQDPSLTSMLRRLHQPAPLGLERAQPGDRVADFQLVQLLGRGGMGEVWEAEQLSLGRRVALKLVRPDRIDERTLSRFQREARAGARLQHPAIATVHGFGRQGRIAWIALELVPGGLSLKDFLSEVRGLETLPRDYYPRVAQFVARVADALAAVHAAGVIHRDVKPQNILVTSEDEPKLVDFGLARVMDESALSRTGEFAGTYLYMSPEQVAAGRMGIDHRTDVFSLGVVLYELLAFTRPFEGDTTHQIAAKILTHDPPDLRALRSQVPSELAVIAGKALEKAPGDRYASMAGFAADLRRFLAHEPIAARPPSALQRGRKWIVRHPTFSAAIALVVAGLAITSWLALRAGERAVEARAQRSDVLRLAAASELALLEEEARGLWPAVPGRIEAYASWIARAQELFDGLERGATDTGPGHRARLAELRAQALPYEPADRTEDRRTHPRAGELARLRAELDALHAAQEVRDGGFPPEVSELPEAELYAESARGRIAGARELAGPERVRYGREPQGLELAMEGARLAEENGEGELQAEATEALAWALFAIGEDDEALALAELLLELAPEWRLEEFESSRARLASAIEGVEGRRTELEARIAELDALVSQRRTWRYDDPDLRWWDSELERLIAAIEAFADPLLGTWRAPMTAHGWGVEERLEHARWLQQSSSDDQAAWSRALASIADPEECPAYGGLRLGIEPALVPIGRDPRSGLWEFAHRTSGEPPARGADGGLVFGPESGVVLVLLPGGRFQMGSQSGDPDAPNYDPAAASEEAVRVIELPPFYASKYELTRAQWDRCAPPNTDSLGATPEQREVSSIYPTSPMDAVNWNTARELLPRLGLSLPTEAQWEYAARAGAETPWWCGADPGCLADCANVCDLLGGRDARFEGHEWNDGWVRFATVGEFRANAFGLHDVLGNVEEWCLDPFAPGDLAPDALRVSRGGSFASPASEARCTHREPNPPDYSGEVNGLRPVLAARVLEP